MQAIRDVEDYPLYLLADFLGGLDALERLKRHAGFAFGSCLLRLALLLYG